MEITSQSSKVTVEYHDAAGVFPLVSRDIAARLPLRNLNWQSPPRPLRQIKSLHLDFVPDSETLENTRSSSSRPASAEQNSLDIVRGGTDARKHTPKERRHQIPGFRTSPYLKIYILRCDDKDAYKDDARRKIREWIKENAQPEGKRDDHDAFEWLILHVVIPDTVAASEPRWRESNRDPDELKERKGGTKIIGKSTRTVFDRLRADFNESGKSGQDRVAQIRLPKDQVPADLLPTPAVAQTLEESPQERENAWNHLVAKFKSLILGPFDRRVRQYESDIAEQEARRSLPGWNFCTFFIHKEGLAKALESIGLVEDALAIYDELSLGLETVLRDIAAGQAQGTATSFAAHTDDIAQRIVGQPQTKPNGIHDDTTDEKRDAAALFSKDYRERIVMSTISVFDFLCYIFARQKTLILRLANARWIRVQLGVDASREGGEDLVLTSEVCWRASSFIHTAARTLRQDLSNRAESTEKGPDQAEIEELVSSWVWAVTGQVLEETAVPALQHITKYGERDASDMPNGTARRPTLTIGLGANTHPQRTTSLPVSKIKADEVQRPRSEDRSITDLGSRELPMPGGEVIRPAGIPGQAELATYRAELLTVRRKMLEQVGRRHGWYAGWSYTRQQRYSSYVAVDVDNARDSVLGDKEHALPRKQNLSTTLHLALGSEASFWDAYARLTDSAIRHYYAATQSKSAETLLGDLAILECQRSNYESAAAYFQHILPLISVPRWSLMETEALSIYSDCLRRLGRHQQFVETSLALIAKLVARRTDQRPPGTEWMSSSVVSQRSGVSVTFEDVISASADLPIDVIRPVKDFFSDVHLDCELSHDEDSDAFDLVLRFQHVLNDEVMLDEISAKLVGLDDPSLEVILKTRKPVHLVHGMNEVRLRSTAVAYGPFLVERIVLAAKRILFVEELRPPPQPTPLGFTEAKPPEVTIIEPEKSPAFAFLYPSCRALSADVRRSPTIDIDKARRLEISLNTGFNEVEGLMIRLKPISAGLRLHTADAVSRGIEKHAQTASKPGQLTFEGIAARANAVVTVPYTVEQTNQDIAVRVEVEYRTSGDTYTFLQSCKLPNQLPLDVDVNDMFHHESLFSNFTVRTTTPLPLSLLSADLRDSPIYAVVKPPALPLPLTVHKSQPVSLVYKITRKADAAKETIKRDAALALRLCYHPLDELLLSCLRQALLKDLVGTPFEPLRRLLVPFLLDRAKQSMAPTDLDVAALLGEARIPSYEDVGWHEVVSTLKQELREDLQSWLRQWHAGRTAILITGADSREATRELAISVDVPNVDIVFTAELDLLDLQPHADLQPTIAVQGRPIQARLRIKHTKQWSAGSLFPNIPTLKLHSDEPQTPNFVCDVVADSSDTWTVGGQRRSHFTLQEDRREHVINLVLVPLRVGVWHLPIVEIHQDISDLEGSAKESALSCETHFENTEQVVQIIRDSKTERVIILEAPPAAATNVALPPSRPGTASTAMKEGT